MTPRPAFRTAFALAVATAATANAQDDGAATPAPPEQADGAATPAPQADEGPASTSEDLKAVEEEEPKTPFRGTALKWSQALTTTAVGVGQDFQSDAGQSYAHGYWALLNYYLVDAESAKLRIATSPGFDVEYTNADDTTDLREPQFRDMNLSLSASLPVWRDSKEEYGVTVLPNATVLFPTSELSQASSTYLVASPRITVGVDGPLLRSGAFPSLIQIATSLRWDHRFSAATEPVNPAIAAQARQAPTGEPYFSDQLSGVPFAHDVIQAGGFVYFEGLVAGGMLEFLTSMSWSNQYLYDFDDDVCVATLGGPCAPILGTNDAATTRVVTTFSVDFTYYPMPEWGLLLGYQNAASQLAPDGQRRSPFYSPDAAFTTQFILSLDALYEAAQGKRRQTRFVLPG